MNFNFNYYNHSLWAFKLSNKGNQDLKFIYLYSNRPLICPSHPVSLIVDLLLFICKILKVYSLFLPFLVSCDFRAKKRHRLSYLSWFLYAFSHYAHIFSFFSFCWSGCFYNKTCKFLKYSRMRLFSLWLLSLLQDIPVTHRLMPYFRYNIHRKLRCYIHSPILPYNQLNTRYK